MITKCDTCGRVYDDTSKWAICPHNPLASGPSVRDFCFRHDLFGPCPICDPTVTREQLHPQTAAIYDIGGEG